MEYFVIALLLIIMLLLIGFSRVQKQSFENIPAKENIFSNFCPLCGSGLKKGERVKSAAYPARPGSDGKYPGGTEKMMEVYGCHHCIPPEGIEKRICPVCKKEVPLKGHVVGRYFIPSKNSNGQKEKKNHLHVLSCTGCRRA
jgi:hypothetical protein